MGYKDSRINNVEPKQIAYSSKHTSIDLGWVSLGLRATQYLLALDTSNNIAIWDHRKKTEKK